jgi:pimeloyl-ACP methyl ester carboxylesterase/uncharacterized membrane protein HdeD (DUF308 family)
VSGTDLSALRLHVRYDEGSGPVIVLLHGINSDATDWRPVIDLIGPGYRCIAPDVLGFGESPKPLDIDYTADEHVEVLEATLAELGISERFVLVGYSLGGDIAVRYASSYPERLRRLFLLSTPFYLPPEYYARRKFGPKYLQEIVAQGLWKLVAAQKQRGGLVYDLASGRLEEFAKGFLRTDDVSEHWDIMGKNLTNTIGAATFVDDLPHLTMPTVFALGVRDPIVRPDQTPALKRLKPDLEIRRIVGLTADHFMLMNIPERVAEEVMRDEVKRLNVAYRAGHGDPVVLLPNLDDGAPAWRPVAEALSKDADAVALDLLGFGGSPAPLSSHYTVEDHVAAVLATLHQLFGTRRVTLVGHGFGALVCLGCAATDPTSVARVVAFSPTLLPPGVTAEDYERDPAVAELFAKRDSLVSVADDERLQAIASEQLERQVVPSLRSLSSVLRVDAAQLIGRVRTPVRFVLPTRDTTVSVAWLRELAVSAPGLEVAEPDGDRAMPFRHPVEAVELIGGATEGQLATARRVRAAHARRRPVLSTAFSSVSGQLVRRGLLMLLAGLPLLFLPTIPARLIPIGLAIYLLVESIQTIVGAVGLKRAGKGWLPWVLIGVVSLLFALFLAVREEFALFLTWMVVAAWTFVRGVTDLYIARSADEVPGRRWSLAVEGVLSLTVTLLLVVEPQAGARLLRYVLGGYLTANGLTSLAFAWSIHRDAKARLGKVLEASPRNGPTSSEASRSG